jgi:hypothetical protein
MRTNRKLLALLGAALLAGCGPEAVQELTAPSVRGAQIKFFNFGVNAPGVNFYANDIKMTAINADACSILTDANRERCTTAGAEATTGVNFGGVGSGGYYAQIAPGQYTLTARIAAAQDKDRAISTVSATLDDGKFYSYYQSGSYNSTARTVDAFVVEDPVIPNFDWSVAYVRFVNAISNSEPMTLSVTDPNTGTELAVGGAVGYKSAGAFTAVPMGVYNLATRTASSATNTITRSAVSFNAGRVYTITARGDITATTGTAVPFLDNTTNR